MGPPPAFVSHRFKARWQFALGSHQVERAASCHSSPWMDGWYNPLVQGQRAICRNTLGLSLQSCFVVGCACCKLLRASLGLMVKEIKMPQSQDPRHVAMGSVVGHQARWPRARPDGPEVPGTASSMQSRVMPRIGTGGVAGQAKRAHGPHQPEDLHMCHSIQERMGSTKHILERVSQLQHTTGI